MSIRKLSDELQAVAIQELNEDPGRIQGDLSYIKEWLSKQPHLKTRLGDQFLLTFLRGTKFSLERTKEKLDMHYTLKTITPEIYQNRDSFDPEIQKILSLGVMVPLPRLAHPSGPRCIFIRNGLIEKHNLDHATVFKVSTMIQDIMMLEDDNLAVSGLILVQDMSDISMSFLKSLPITLMKKAMTCFQHGYPHRIKGGHFFNITKVFDALFSVVKPFLTEKIKRRMCIYGSVEELYTAVAKETLPEEYGGQGGSIPEIMAEWKTKVESYANWFKEDEMFRTDETKRPGKPKTSESVFGVDGSFRQLAVD